MLTKRFQSHRWENVAKIDCVGAFHLMWIGRERNKYIYWGKKKTKSVYFKEGWGSTKMNELNPIMLARTFEATEKKKWNNIMGYYCRLCVLQRHSKFNEVKSRILMTRKFDVTSFETLVIWGGVWERNHKIRKKSLMNEKQESTRHEWM